MATLFALLDECHVDNIVPRRTLQPPGTTKVVHSVSPNTGLDLHPEENPVLKLAILVYSVEFKNEGDSSFSHGDLPPPRRGSP